MECHKCDWYGNPKLTDLPFEKTPCASCELAEGTPRNWATGMIDVVPEPEARAAKAGDEVVVPESSCEVVPLSAVAEALRLVLGLPATEFVVVQARYLGLSTLEIAEKLGFGRRKVEYILSRVVVANPVLTALFPRKFRRGPRAKS